MEGSGARAGGAVRVDFDLRPVTIRTDDRTLLAQGDGDTVTIDQPVRMVSVDVRDMRTRGRLDWADVPEWARLWIWEEDREEAVPRLGVVGA